MGRKRMEDAATERESASNGEAIATEKQDSESQSPESAPKESKSDKWKRLANRRTSRAIKDIRSLIPLASKGQYEYTEEHAQMLVAVLYEALTEVKRAYEGKRQANPTVLFR